MKSTKNETIKLIVKDYIKFNVVDKNIFLKKFKVNGRPLKNSTLTTYCSKNKSMSGVFLKKFCTLKDLNVELKKKILTILKEEENKNIEQLNFNMELNKINHELANKKLLLEEIQRNIKKAQLEFEKLERTSGVRSQITWDCIEVQKVATTKIVEVTSLYNLTNEINRKECQPAIYQLSKHLDTFSKQLRHLLQVTTIEGE